MKRFSLATALLVSLLLGAGTDPGVLLELDREQFELTVRDLRRAADGPRLRVVLGSPGHPTPAGSFPLYRVIRNPRWTPGALARDAGAQRTLPSRHGPMGVAKIPFAAGGIALHGAADPLLLGKPVSLGCVRLADGELLALLDWLKLRSVLGPQRRSPDGEHYQDFWRPAHLVVR